MLKKDLSEIERILSQKPKFASTLLAVTHATNSVQYGEITVKMQGGKPVWVHETERERVGD